MTLTSGARCVRTLTASLSPVSCRKIDAFASDFPAALDRAKALDKKLMDDAAKISSNYVDLVSLAARQVFGSLDITAFADSNGKFDPSDVKIFMKDMGYSS